MQKQEKKHNSALQDNKQEGPGQVVMHLRATSVPPGYHDRGGSLCSLRRDLWHLCAWCCYAQGMEKQRTAEPGWLFERLEKASPFPS